MWSETYSQIGLAWQRYKLKNKEADGADESIHKTNLLRVGSAYMLVLICGNSFAVNPHRTTNLPMLSPLYEVVTVGRASQLRHRGVNGVLLANYIF